MKHRLLSLKIDSGTRLSRNIFGISAQFISKNEIRSRILGMVELKGPNASASNILAKEILSTLTKYDIQIGQIVSITSDNGANMIKTTKLLSQYCTNEDDIEIFQISIDVRLGEIQICRCAAHTAQLCALDITKNADIRKYLLQCRNMTKYVRKLSNGYREIFEFKKLPLPQLDYPTRWGSTYHMVERLNKAKDILSHIESVENKTEDENFDANKCFWNFMASYSTVLNPLQKTIVKFQEEQLHYGNFYALCLMESIETRTHKLLSNASLDACLFLDPRFHQMLNDSQRVEAVAYLKKLWEKIKSHVPKLLHSSNPSHLTATESVQVLEEDDDDLLNEYLAANLVPTDEWIDVYLKIERLNLPFMKANLNVLNFWKERQCSDPELYALSGFAIPPTQVIIERAFSSLKLILADNRNRLNHDTLENKLLVKFNPSFLDQSIENLPLFEENEDE
ncbi:zinc finger BED domain-containing protein 4-like [Teleopsis dalmanni]|uniref:zinc finger BED domain-containing protein 4-like n=1 Tax=Teleopsis dalmanni TaxID=139649 RepID=UPI0018CFD7A4|nr:zinc finger BED domain-containing protein 4-like [Teleopsis dalmanni]